ncbi:hypothetical protein GJQ55_02320 [Venatoribacter cucullus]|uniref:Uncharacterized protein n=1 Tax=Venatoribacter cucullus TaxID=2661630 RepID=A0A9X7YN56_9GAMM|nr:hypothetical protein [Venatoribacter cucullus]QQD23384.1 hypothetical protein GJQ55_02320 [Venatoribacter cucullus]
MNSSMLKTFLAAAAVALALPASAAGQDLDKLLSSIKADIAAQRLASPAGNNALERIDAFRAQAPYDFRIVPLAYQWGESYVALANKAIDAKEFDKAQAYLDRVWLVAALTPGLEEVQDKLDKLYKPSSTQVAKGPSQEDLERQRRAAAAAAAEKARVEAERKRRLDEEKRQAEADKKRAEQDRLRRQEEERQRRAEAEQAEKAAAAQRLANVKATAPAAAPAAPVVAVRAVTAAPAASEAPASVKEIVALWNDAEESSAALATYPVSAQQLQDRDRKISASLEPVCKAIIDNDASVVVHTADKADYRWLTVRLTLCLRRLDKDFRLRHSHQDLAEAAPFVTLHPPREVSLVRQVSD